MRSDAAANRAALIAAALELHAARADEVPLSTVARRAGVGIATLYRHFPTQADLRVGVLEHLRDQVLTLCQEHLPALAAQPHEAWPVFVADLADLKLAAVIPNLVQDLDPRHPPPRLAETQRLAFAALDAVLTQAKNAGLVRAEISPPQFHIGLAIIARPFPDPADSAITDERHWLIQTYLRGLRPAP